MRIGKVAQRAGVNVQTLRYYERRGLLPDPRGRRSRYRDYEADAVQLVRFIKEAQELGFTLKEVGELIELRDHGTRRRQDVRALAAAKVEQIQNRVDRLTIMKRGLEDLIAACRTSDGRPCCPIIEAMEGASRHKPLTPSVPSPPARAS